MLVVFREDEMTGDWLYFTGSGITVRQIAQALGPDCETEIWEEAGVLEVMLGDGASMDFEASEIRPKDEAARAFADAHGCRQVFLVTFPPEEYEKARVRMQQIQRALSGVFCGDTEDMTPVLGKDISGRTGVLALFGSPVGHSGSPAMYNYCFKKFGLDYIYVAFDIKEEDVATAAAAMRTFRMRGCNVTMPCKNEFVKYMDELSPAARMMGAVNTIVNEDGRLIGYNTDGAGVVNCLADRGITVPGKKLIVTGTGGAATSIQIQSALDGAAALAIFARTPAKALQTVENIRKERPECKVDVYDIADTARMTEEMRTADIFINATSVGMSPKEDESVVKDLDGFRPGLVVMDAVYEPVQTKLLTDAAAAGCTCVSGKGMLLWQGVEAFRLYTGLEMPVEEVRRECFS